MIGFTSIGPLSRISTQSASVRAWMIIHTPAMATATMPMGDDDEDGENEGDDGDDGDDDGR